MSDPLEKIIRPFESGNVSPAQNYYPAGQIGVLNVKLQYGHRSGSGKTISGSFSESQSFYCANAHNEKERPTSHNHIARLVGKNRDGGVETDVWIDVDRRDRIEANFEGRDGDTTEWDISLKWDDREGEDGNPARKYKTLKICAADEEDYEDPEVFVELKVIEEMHFSESETGSGLMRTFKLDADNNGRKVKALSIHHRSTNIDKPSEAAFEAGDRVYVVSDSKDYKFTDGEEDFDDFIEIEAPKRLSTEASNEADISNGTEMDTVVVMRNASYIEDSGFKEAKKERTGPDGINPPYRLDPYQRIMNVNFGGIAVEFYKDAT